MMERDAARSDTSQNGSSPVHVILGATGGIGSALARRLAADGARLVLGARGKESLERLASSLDATPFSLDATSFDQVSTLVETAVARHGRVDGLANCVGSLLLKPAHLTTAEEWQATIATNLTSAFAAVRSAAKAMRGGGSIVLVASAAATVGLPNHDAIAAAKAGVIGLTRSAAASYASRGVRVNCVAPGLVKTGLTARLTASDAATKASIAMHPLGRLGEPDEIAAAIAWLLAPEQSWITGQDLGVDGGLAGLRPRAKA